MKKIRFVLLFFIVFNYSKICFSQVEMLTDFNFKGYNQIDVVQKIGKNFVYFVKYNGIWKTDGTKQGTEELYSNIDSLGEPISFLNPFGILNDESIFLGSNNKTGYELWKSDGTKKGTKIIIDFFSGDKGVVANKCNIEESAILDNYLYFKSFDSEGNICLMRSDGTANGTELLINNIDTSAETFHYFLTPIYNWNSRLYFFKDTLDNGLRLCEINLQDKSYKQVAKFNNTFRILESKLVNDSTVILLTQRPKTDQSDLISFNLNSNKIVNIKWFEKGLGYDKSTQYLFHPLFHNYNIKEYFFANNDQGETELWKTDGTVQGTKSVIVLLKTNKPYFFLLYNNERYFYANINDKCGIYKLNSLDNISNLLTFPLYCPGSNSIDMIVLGDDLIFEGNYDYPFQPNNIGYELYSYNFTSKDTSLIVNLNMKQNGDPAYFEKIDENTIVFEGTYEDSNNALYSYHKNPVKTIDLYNKDNLQIYPNPVKNYVALKLSEFNDFQTYEIIDMLGRQVKKGSISEDILQTINVESLLKGYYFINLSGKKGITSLKIVKN